MNLLLQDLAAVCSENGGAGWDAKNGIDIEVAMLARNASRSASLVHRLIDCRVRGCSCGLGVFHVELKDTSLIDHNVEVNRFAKFGGQPAESNRLLGGTFL